MGLASTHPPRTHRRSGARFVLALVAACGTTAAGAGAGVLIHGTRFSGAPGGTPRTPGATALVAMRAPAAAALPALVPVVPMTAIGASIPVEPEKKAPRAQCPQLAAVDPPWLVVGPPAPASADLPQSPKSLERRIALWLKVWGERGDNQHLLVDDRRPWIVHGEVDCRDLFPEGTAPDDANAKGVCGGRITQARKAAQLKLKREWHWPSVLRSYDRDRSLARTATDHIIAIQGRKDALDRARSRAQPHLGIAEGLFANADVPRIYARAAIVESLWRPEALSRSGAAGAYQFMPKTGRQFLTVEDGIVDERLDPLRASWAAATYMSKMEKELGDWSLVLTAYNTGPARLKKVMKARRTRDLGRIADAGDFGEFGFDGQNYYAQIVAIGRLTVRDRFEPKPVTGRAVKLESALPFAQLAACVDTPKDALAESNPALADAVIAGEKPVPAGYVAHVPSVALTTASR